MPSSTYEHVKTLAAFIHQTRPRSILGVGLGISKEIYLAFRMEELAGRRFAYSSTSRWQPHLTGIA